MNDRHLPLRPPDRAQADVVLPAGARLGPFEVQRLIARGATSFVYLATDHALAMPVALQEYLPMHLVHRDAWLHLHPNDAWHEEVLSRGMRIFIDESRLLARCEHPSLVRVNHLFEANGTAYRVMPFHPGQRLSDVRAAMTEAPAEGPLRALLDPLLGALETVHRFDQVHGGVNAANILLVDGDLPLLLSPGGAAKELRSDLVESLMATVESQPGTLLPEPDPTGPALDLRALAEVMRFCITGDTTPPTRPREPLASLLARSGTWPVYGSEFIGTLDAATSSSPEDWPHSVAQFKLWLTHGTPAARASAPRRALAPLPAAPARPIPERTPEALDARLVEDPPEDPPDVLAFDPYAEGGQDEPYFAPMAVPEPLSPLSGDPVFPDGVVPGRPTTRKKRARGLPAKLLFGGVLAGLAAVLIAWLSGAWNVAPPIALDRAAMAPSVARISVPRTATPATADPEPAPPSPPPAPAPSPAPAAEAQIDPAAIVKAHPPGAGASPRRATRPSAPTRAAAAPSRGPLDPRAACADRTEFALYRCMKQQCAAAKWSSHPQCVRLRLDDQVG